MVNLKKIKFYCFKYIILILVILSESFKTYKKKLNNDKNLI